MIQCGAFDDVYSYEKLKRPNGDGTSQSRVLAKLTRKKTMLFSDSAPQSPTTAKLGGKKSMSCRWITRQSDNTPGNSKRVGTEDTEDKPTPSSLPSKKPKDPSKRVGFVDILLGYHSLLQASSFYPAATQKKQLHPTVGFVRNRNCGTQN